MILTESDSVERHQRFVGPRNRDFSGVALIPDTDKPPGTYKVALYSDDKMLTQQSFIVNQM